MSEKVREREGGERGKRGKSEEEREGERQRQEIEKREREENNFEPVFGFVIKIAKFVMVFLVLITLQTTCRQVFTKLSFSSYLKNGFKKLERYITQCQKGLPVTNIVGY